MYIHFENESPGIEFVFLIDEIDLQAERCRAYTDYFLFTTK